MYDNYSKKMNNIEIKKYIRCVEDKLISNYKAQELIIHGITLHQLIDILDSDVYVDKLSFLFGLSRTRRLDRLKKRVDKLRLINNDYYTEFPHEFDCYIKKMEEVGLSIDEIFNMNADELFRIKLFGLSTFSFILFMKDYIYKN